MQFYFRLDTVKSFITGLNFVGFIVGGILIGHLMDKFGRKWTSVYLRQHFFYILTIILISGVLWVY